ncbi:MAG: tRNA (adenosine(37)-N6)-threonylcarbamoyltransferase complex dimerization subunit type 1 TsaB [Pseudomonadota bacterium]
MSDPLLLAFDTSGPHCAAALIEGGRVKDSRIEGMAKGQAERLLGLAEELLKDNGASFADISAIGVGVGPGNFTGIRISVAAARGLALSTGAPAIGVTSFEALAYGLPRPVVVCLDARRDAFYLQVFEDSGGSEPQLINAEDFARLALPNGASCVGSAAASAAARCDGRLKSPLCPLADAIGQIAITKLGRVQPRPAPLYLRPADAVPAAAPPKILT